MALLVIVIVLAIVLVIYNFISPTLNLKEDPEDSPAIKKDLPKAGEKEIAQGAEIISLKESLRKQEVESGALKSENAELKKRLAAEEKEKKEKLALCERLNEIAKEKDEKIRSLDAKNTKLSAELKNLKEKFRQLETDAKASAEAKAPADTETVGEAERIKASAGEAPEGEAKSSLKEKKQDKAQENQAEDVHSSPEDDPSAADRLKEDL